jgi:hypothetical protein
MNSFVGVLDDVRIAPVPLQMKYVRSGRVRVHVHISVTKSVKGVNIVLKRVNVAIARYRKNFVD